MNPKAIGGTLAAMTAVAFASATPAWCQTGTVPPSSMSTEQMSTQTKTTTTTPVATAYVNDQAQSLHDQAVTLAHRATWAAQHHEPKLAAKLADQAEQLFCQAWTTTGIYAHRTGQSEPMP